MSLTLIFGGLVFLLVVVAGIMLGTRVHAQPPLTRSEPGATVDPDYWSDDRWWER